MQGPSLHQTLGRSLAWAEKSQGCTKTPTNKMRRSIPHADHSRQPRLTEQGPMKGVRKDERTASRSPVPVASGVLAVSMTELGGQP